MTDPNSSYVPPPSEVSTPSGRPGSKLFGILAVIIGVSAVTWFRVSHIEQQEQQARQGKQVLASVREMRDEGLKDMEKGDTTSQLKRMEKIEGEMQKFASNATGADAKMARASARFLNYSRTGAEAFQAAIQEAVAAKIFEFGNIKNREALEARRALARNVMQKNAALRAQFENAEKAMRQILLEEKFSPAETEKFLGSFLESSRSKLQFSNRIRSANHNMMQALLQMCDQIDREWGKWKAQPDGSVEFTSKTANAAFAKLVETVQQCAADEQKATQDLVASSKAASASAAPKRPSSAALSR